MKVQDSTKNTTFLKKIFIKLCRLMGYEIIDQSDFYVPTQQKRLDENLNIQGKKSITLPLGETKIVRKVTALTIVFRSCTNVNMLTQKKRRLFDKEKSEYTFRSINSIIKSINFAKKSGIGLSVLVGFIQDCLSGSLLGVNTLSKGLLGVFFSALKDNRIF